MVAGGTTGPAVPGQDGPALAADGAPASPRLLTRRRLRISLASLWLSAAALQAQPFMFTAGFGRRVLLPAAAGQPAALAAAIRVAAAAVLWRPAAADAVFVAVQAFLGLALLADRAARPALAASAAWGFGVWVLGEGLGGLLSGPANLLAGAPGPAALYAALAAAAWPPPGNPSRLAPLPRWAPALQAAAWLLIIATGPWPGSAAGRALAGQLAACVGQPALPGHLLAGAAAFTARRPAPVAAALTAAEALAGIGALARGRARHMAAMSGAALAGLISLAQALGGVASGHATDVGSGPPLLLLAVAAWSAPAARRPGGSRQPRSGVASWRRRMSPRSRSASAR